MIKLIELKNLAQTPWKNGKGLTRQIAIAPPHAHFPTDDFDWRLSSAEVSSDNSFSNFQGYDRILTIVSGAGLTLNDKILSFGEVYHFPGEQTVDCRLINGPVVDLGLIYHREKFTAKSEVKRPGARHEVHTDENESLILCALMGQLHADQYHLNQGDCLHIGPGGKFSWHSEGDTWACYFLLRKR